MKNILEFLESNAERFADKVAFMDENTKLTYAQLLQSAESIGSHLCRYAFHNQPMAVYLDKSPKVIEAMMGIIYSGNFYVIIDSEMPLERIEKYFQLSILL